LEEEVIDGTTRTISYTYDAVSNRLTRNDSGEGNTTYEYDRNDRLLKEVTNGVTTNYTYDNNGNTLSKTTGTDKVNYQWNAENRLVGLDNNGDGVNEITNKYDSDGIRISQIVNGEETRFLVDKNRDYAQVLEEYTPSKIIKASYIYGNDLISQLRNNQRSFYHVDGLGSTRALTDINGLVSDRYAYEAFGEIIKQLGNTQNLYLFAGEQRDPNLGLDYLRARYLDVSTGRFYGRDPFKGILTLPNSLHPYIYTGNNSVNLIDPSGLTFLFSSIIDFGFQINTGAIVRTSSAAAARNQFLRILFGRPPQDIGIVGEFILQSIINSVESIAGETFGNKGAAGTAAHKRLEKEIASYKPIAGVEVKAEVFLDKNRKPVDRNQRDSLGIDIVVLYNKKEVLLIDLKIGKGFSGKHKNELRRRFNGIDLVQVFIKTK
jgi:RHS repeat-associated protein